MGVRVELAIALFVIPFLGVNVALATPDGNTMGSITGNPQYANTNLTGTTDVVCTNYGGDIDHDGVCDNWEVSSPDPSDGNFAGLRVIFTAAGITYKYKYPCDTSITGDCPSTSHKDLYVEVDWMKHHDIDQMVVANVTSAFRNAPTPIYLHMQLGENPSDPTFSQRGNITQHFTSVRYYKTSSLPTYVGLATLKQLYFGTVAERQNASSLACPNNSVPSGLVPPLSSSYSYNCLTAKRFAFHYAMFANNIYGYPETSGYAEKPGNDILITLGSFINGKGSIDEQEATFMHELGHNLGLTHGGTQSIPSGSTEDDVSCKPNYLSIMSNEYLYRETYDVCRPLDFSRSGSLGSLPEGLLSDSNVVGTYPYPSNNPPPPPNTIVGQPSTCPTSGERPFWWNNTLSRSNKGWTGSASVDWNGGGSSSYTDNLNGLGITGCSGKKLLTLTSSNDWASLNFVFVNQTNNFNSAYVPAPPGGTDDYFGEGSGFNATTGEQFYYGGGTEATSYEVDVLRAQNIMSSLGNEFNTIPQSDFNSDTGRMAYQSLIILASNAAENGKLDDYVQYLGMIKLLLHSDSTDSAFFRDVSEKQKLNTMVTESIATVPEFGSLSVIILIISFVSIILITRIKMKSYTIFRR